MLSAIFQKHIYTHTYILIKSLFDYIKFMEKCKTITSLLKATCKMQSIMPPYFHGFIIWKLYKAVPSQYLLLIKKNIVDSKEIQWKKKIS